jgi:glycosyltransferase involved in cell wall biosynthesis
MPEQDSNEKICFVLPTKNESASIGGVIDSIWDLGKRMNWQCSVIVADDSTDSTAAVAQQVGAEVVSGGGVGLGAAIIHGMRAALRKNPAWIVTMDSDGQVDTSELPRFLETAKKENAQMVISSRFLGGKRFDYPYPFLNWVGNRLLVSILYLSTGKAFTDSHGGIRLIRAELAETFFLIGKHTYVQETLIQASASGAKIVELPSRWKVRAFGQSRVLHSIFRYVYRTLPALLFHMKFQYGTFGMGLLFLFYFQKTQQLSLFFAASLCISLAIYLVGIGFAKLKVK